MSVTVGFFFFCRGGDSPCTGNLQVTSESGRHTNRNVPKFSDRQVRANSADPDQTAPRVFAIPSASFGCITSRKSHFVELLG